MPLAVYIHWPFCLAKCPYCDFNSHVRGEIHHAQWKAALRKELAYFAAAYPGHTVNSIFFGGGTPSLMEPDTVQALVDDVTQHWSIDDQIEITLEANPTSIEMENLAAFKQAGVNRVSLGVQSLRQEALTFLGREHSSSEALKAVDMAAALFNRFSFDLIYALPNQTLDEWEIELKEALRYAGNHLSLYQLTIEPNTAFHYLYHDKKSFKLPEDTLAADMFLLTQDIMNDAGLPAYEVSNHAAPGEESRHNMAYWTGLPYLGTGPGAHGRPCDGDVWRRTETQKSPERWLETVEQNGHGLIENHVLDDEHRLEERLMVGLRLQEGMVVNDNILALIDHKFMSQAIDAQLLVKEENRLRATPHGWLVLNHLIGKLLR